MFGTAKDNRQSRIVIETETGNTVGVLLAAGLIARRITQWALPGVLALGQRLAIIHIALAEAGSVRQSGSVAQVGR